MTRNRGGTRRFEVLAKSFASFRDLRRKTKEQNCGIRKKTPLLMVFVLCLSFLLLRFYISFRCPSTSYATHEELQAQRLSRLQEPLVRLSMENENGLSSGVSDLGSAQAPFEVLRSDALNTLHDEACKEHTDECVVYNNRLGELQRISRLQWNAKPRLFVMSLDPLAWKHSNEQESKAVLNTDIESVVQYVKSRRAFINWRASDHVFVCLSANCSTIISTFSERLSNNEGTRAILVMNDPHQEVLKWPCPLRIINADDYSKAEGQFWKELLRDLTKLIDRETRWRCSDDLHPVQHWQNASDNVRRHGRLDSRNDYLFCTIPKCASTALHMFIRRSMGMKDYANKRLSHAMTKNGLKQIDSMHDPKLTHDVFSDESIITGMIVRNPASRLLSAYLDKIVYAGQYNRVEGLSRFYIARRTPTFSEFVHTLINNQPDSSQAEPHFKSLSSQCGSSSTAYDFVGDLENFHEEFVEFTESIGLWRKYGEFGWGEYRNQSFVDACVYKQAPHKTMERLWEYYDEDLLRKVYDYYEDDFIRFHYSIDEMIAQMPEEKRQ